MPNPGPTPDPRYTCPAGSSRATDAAGRQEWHRQAYFLRKFPEWRGPVPPKEISDEMYRKYKKSDSRITVRASVDKKEYNRQKKYVQKHPDCKEVPPKRIPICNDPRMSVGRYEDNKEFQRQYIYLKNHPDCKEIPNAEDAKRETYARLSQLWAEKRVERIKKAEIKVSNMKACGLLNPVGRPVKPPPCPTRKLTKIKRDIPTGQVSFGGLTRPKGEHYNHHYNGWRNFVVMFNPHV